MAQSPDKDLLRQLCLAPGPPGAEQPVRDIVREQLAGLGPITYDKLGSLLCEKEGLAEGPRIQLDSHLDEVGFMVQSISREGRLGFVPLGGWWGHVLLGQRVEILTDTTRIPGVFGAKPPHFLSEAERNKVLPLDAMYIDVGATTQAEVEAAGVRVGDPIVPVSPFVELAVPGALSCKALDNRLGVAVMCETMQALKGTSHPNTVVAVASVQEEMGLRGAQTSSAMASPDVAIVLECTPADDLPGFTERQAVLGGGPQIRFFDPTAISNRRLVQFVERTASENDIPIQLAVRRSGGTDAGAIHKGNHGVPTVVIGVPARYIHTHAGVMHWKDYQAACALVLKLMLGLDADTVAQFTRFE
jgi:putative aminopeptidase FrvX